MHSTPGNYRTRSRELLNSTIERPTVLPIFGHLCKNVTFTDNDQFRLFGKFRSVNQNGSNLGRVGNTDGQPTLIFKNTNISNWPPN